jgi:TolA-binding protein
MRQVVIALAVLTAVAVSGVSSANARTVWQSNHPRRTQVNGRLANQDARIPRERATGQITGAQAHRLHEQDHQIRQEERDMASRNGSHITRAEQAMLNHQENVTSREIGR